MAGVTRFTRQLVLSAAPVALAAAALAAAPGAAGAQEVDFSGETVE